MEVRLKEFNDKTIIFYSETKGDEFFVYEINIIPKKKVKTEKRNFKFNVNIGEKRTEGDLNEIFNCKVKDLVRIVFKKSYPFVIKLSELQ